ncbi:MAG TPA: FlgD immunoglobulin-like domain containing protein [Candidatus Krumholzibacteria bacterium]|nr:FlgD immunoglobulin-like domain containing protein [Candidatus Krumholzibacteria bacterium]
MRFLLTLVVCLALFCAPAASALTRFDFEQPYFSDPAGQSVLDHCVVQVDSVYHLFYLRGNPAVNIGHATTTDFTHWTYEPPVLSPGSWDTVLWAPCLIKPANPTWFMYYTGVNVAGAQQTGLAFSNNLYNWSKYPDPVYHPDTSWAVWNSTTFCHGRDPHVMEIDGTYYMFVTAQHEWYKGAVACATSTDLIHWTDQGYIYLHNSWHMLESVFILQRNGLFHMFFTEEGVYGTQHMSSPTLFGGWDYSHVDYIDNGHAPQITDTPSGPIFSRHSVYNDGHGVYRYVLKFSPLLWFGDTPSVPRSFPLQPDWDFVEGDAFYYQPTFQNNAYARNEGSPSSFVGDGWINTYELYTGPLGYGSPGQSVGDGRTGIIRSKPFSIQGNSISLLVGGGSSPDACYVALVDHDSGDVLFKETGNNTDVMDRRYWDVSHLMGRTVQIEIADLSTESHVCVDDIIESGNRVSTTVIQGKGLNRRTRGNASLLTTALPGGPTRFLANTPNPFNPRTTVQFQLASAATVRVDVYDASGRLIRTLLDGARPAGRHSLEWDGTDHAGRGVASGVYFARLRVDGAVMDTRKMMLLK